MGASDSDEVPSEMKPSTRSRISTKDFSFFSFDDDALGKTDEEVLVFVFAFADDEALPSPAPLADIQPPPAPPTSGYISLPMHSLEEEAFGGRIRIRGFFLFFFFFFLILF